MRVDVRIENQRVVLRLSGHVTRNASESAVSVLPLRDTPGENEDLEALQNRIIHSLNEGYREIVLDVKDVVYVDSAGLGVILGLNTIVRCHGGVFKIEGLDSRLRKVFAIGKPTDFPWTANPSLVPSPIDPDLNDIRAKAVVAAGLFVIPIMFVMIVLRWGGVFDSR